MLNYLQIDNYALIEHSEIEFFPGFNVITGESGAGKSIMLGALSFLPGERTGQNVLRSGASRCSVSALFTVPEALRAPSCVVGYSAISFCASWKVSVGMI